MRVTYNWLKQYMDLSDITPEQVAEIMTRGGLEVEGMEKLASATDLVIGKVLECEKHPKADKLLVSQIKIGPEVRQIVSGIAKWYKPEEMVGKKVLVVCNLKPVTLRGVESQGMILCAEDENGNLEAVTVDKVEDGAEVH